jgi:hypothetical protein
VAQSHTPRNRCLPRDRCHVGLAQPGSGFDQRIEHGLEIEGRAADDLEHVGTATGRAVLESKTIHIPDVLNYPPRDGSGAKDPTGRPPPGRCERTRRRSEWLNSRSRSEPALAAAPESCALYRDEVVDSVSAAAVGALEAIFAIAS